MTNIQNDTYLCHESMQFHGRYDDLPELKVRKFQNEYMKLSHCPKYEQKNRQILPYTSEQNFSNFFVLILGNARTSHIHSEISWPLRNK